MIYVESEPGAGGGEESVRQADYDWRRTED